MSDTLDLMRAVLAHTCTDDAQARALLTSALEREVDPLVHVSVVLGIAPDLVMERAARHLGCNYCPKVPDGIEDWAAPIRLEMLAEVRLLRIRATDRDLAYAAPDYFGLLRLQERLGATPALRRRIVLLPQQALLDFLTASAAEALLVEARQKLARNWPFASAQLELTKPARGGFVLAIGLLVMLILTAPHIAPFWLWPLTIFLVGPAVIRLSAIVTPRLARLPPLQLEDAELPVYSVLVPLRNEAAMVPQLFRGLSALHYPAERLDIKFVVEAGSPETVAAVRQHPLDHRFSLVVVPEAAPSTKPKAINYALPLCRGEYVVVFDAEDVPEPDQLRKAVGRFREDPELTCLQAPLVITNGRSNILAALFAGEYAGLFGVLLPALARWRLPMPLGGTSNHFDITRLRGIGGWDAYNVTEDADLGARLARRSLKVDVLDSATYEAAPLRLRPWLGQRTRWMKGWMQTFIVHNRDPGKLFAQMGLWKALAFEVMTLGMITAPLLHCGVAIDLTVRLLLGQPLLEGSAPGLFYLAILSLGYGSSLALTVIGLLRQRRRELLAQQALLPLYWLAIAVATIRAMRELLLRPFHWFKSPHQPELAPGVLPQGRLRGLEPALRTSRK